jgi:hypothetical protein
LEHGEARIQPNRRPTGEKLSNRVELPEKRRNNGLGDGQLIGRFVQW